MRSILSISASEKILKRKSGAGFDISAQALISGWDHEIIAQKRQFILTAYVRERRFDFLGNTLRLPDTELAHKTLVEYHKNLSNRPLGERAFEGTVFADTPHPRDLNAIKAAARDSDSWRSLKSKANFGSKVGREETPPTQGRQLEADDDEDSSLGCDARRAATLRSWRR